MKKYDTVIFDMDGTLLDTLEDISDSINHVLEIYGFPNRKTSDLRSFLGNGAAQLMELAIPGGISNPQFGTCLKDYCNHYQENLQNKTCVYEGVISLLEQLSVGGYKIAIVSNKPDKAVKELAGLYFKEYSKVAIGETDGIARKPAPDTVLKAMKELGSTADKTVYVGDSEVDVATAKNCGIKCVGVTWGFRDREVLEKKGADYIIDKPQELLKIIAG
ncbi:MAG TPA: HAD family hydrolase [Clostridiaceae bacterium]